MGATSPMGRTARSNWASALMWAIVDTQYKRRAGIFGPILVIEQEAAHRIELNRPVRLAGGASNTVTKGSYSAPSRQTPMRMPTTAPSTPLRGKPGIPVHRGGMGESSPDFRRGLSELGTVPSSSMGLRTPAPAPAPP